MASFRLLVVASAAAIANAAPRPQRSALGAAMAGDLDDCLNLDAAAAAVACAVDSSDLTACRCMAYYAELAAAATEDLIAGQHDDQFHYTDNHGSCGVGAVEMQDGSCETCGGESQMCCVLDRNAEGDGGLCEPGLFCDPAQHFLCTAHDDGGEFDDHFDHFFNYNETAFDGSGSGSAGNRCSLECEMEFVFGCIPHHCSGDAEHGFMQCESELAEHVGPLSGMCRPGCEPTSYMQEAESTCADWADAHGFDDDLVHFDNFFDEHFDNDFFDDEHFGPFFDDNHHFVNGSLPSDHYFDDGVNNTVGAAWDMWMDDHDEFDVWFEDHNDTFYFDDHLFSGHYDPDHFFGPCGEGSMLTGPNFECAACGGEGEQCCVLDLNAAGTQDLCEEEHQCVAGSWVCEAVTNDEHEGGNSEDDNNEDGLGSGDLLASVDDDADDAAGATAASVAALLVAVVGATLL